jgi:heavy metal sensor kinase
MLWYIAIFGAVLILYVCAASVLQFWQLTRQVYHGAIEDVETAEGLLYFGQDGRLLMREDYHNHPESLLLIDRMMQVFAPDGSTLYRNDRLGNRYLGGQIFPGEGESGYNERMGRLSDGTRVLLISHVHSIDGRPLLIRLAYDIAPLEQRAAQLVGLLLLALPFALGIGGFAGYNITRRALTPLEDLARRTEQITANRLHDRLPIENPDDELGRIGRVLNELLGRLEYSFDQLRRFTSDASHELRTPLAALRSVGETGLQKECTPEEYRDIIGSMLEEVTRLTRMVESLLTIARADSGELKLAISTFTVLDLVHEAIALVDILAEEKNQSLTVSGDPDIFIRGDRIFLRQAVLNVLHNAVKYSPTGSTIRISVSRSKHFSVGESRAILEIVDEGPGIREEDQPRVFDRFYRVDEGRSRETGGSGLGLAIAKWAVEIHGGQIGVRNVPSEGCCFFMSIPASPSEVKPGPVANGELPNPLPSVKAL